MVVIVVHAEGPGDLGQPAPWVAPRDSLSDDDLGPVHELVRRALEVDARLPAAAIDFREPLRTRAGHRAHGSELLSRRVLDDLFGAWRLGEERPVIVVLVDADGQPAEARAEVIRDAIANSRLRGAVGVAVQELEAWLVSDPAALEQVLGKGHPSPAAAEQCEPREARELLNRWTRAIAHGDRTSTRIRRELAAAVDIDVVADRCSSFRAFRSSLAAALARA